MIHSNEPEFLHNVLNFSRLMHPHIGVQQKHFSVGQHGPFLINCLTQTFESDGIVSTFIAMPLGMYSIRSMRLMSQKTIVFNFWADGSGRGSFGGGDPL